MKSDIKYLTLFTCKNPHKECKDNECLEAIALLEPLQGPLKRKRIQLTHIEDKDGSYIEIFRRYNWKLPLLRTDGKQVDHHSGSQQIKNYVSELGWN